MGELVTPLLKGIPDTKKLGETTNDLSPLGKLVQAYKIRARQDRDLPAIGKNSLGSDLKSAIRHMEPMDQVALLYSYSVLTTGKSALAFGLLDDAADEDRRLRHFMVKVAFIMFAPIPCLITGAAVAIGAKSGAVPNSALVNGLVTSATEILKLILSTH